MATTSLSAYAAWLAKHESKAPRRRSLDTVEHAHTDVVVTKESTSDESTDPYLQWIKRKETKLPLVKIVLASPDSIEAIVERGRAAVATASASASTRMNKTGSTKSQKSTAQADKARSVTSTRVQAPTEQKGKKRMAVETEEQVERAVKKVKTTSATNPTTTNPSVATSTSSTFVTTTVPADVTSKAYQHTPTAPPKSCSSSRLMLPRIEEVRYWQDVDRFSFLA